LALVQGGLLMSGRPNIRQVATLQIEPLHLLVKEELLAGVSNHLGALTGKTVNLGETGSGTHTLALEVLTFAGMKPGDAKEPLTYVPTLFGREQLLSEQDRTRLPDAILQVDPLPSETARYLVTRRGYRVAPLPFGVAFALQSLSTPELEGSSENPNERIDMARIVATTIPAFTYGVEPPIPATTIPTLGARLLLVAHKDVDSSAMRHLIEATYQTDFAKIVHPPLDAKLMEAPPQYRWHEGAQLYRERNKPIVSGPLMDSAHKGFAILAAVASGLFVLWQWSRQYGQFMRDKGFNKYIGQLTRIEEQAVRAERDKQAHLQRLIEWRDQIHQLKTEALDRFTEGELAGKELLSGFLEQANDTRDHISRLIRECETVDRHV
jgi:TRAP-type uncharacterized transport system substrate-binding protein